MQTVPAHISQVHPHHDDQHASKNDTLEVQLAGVIQDPGLMCMTYIPSVPDGHARYEQLLIRLNNPFNLTFFGDHWCVLSIRSCSARHSPALIDLAQ